MRAKRAPTAEGPKTVARIARKPPRILVVDDLDAIRSVAAQFLKAEGYTVVTASSGPEAVEALKLYPCDAVLLDVLMPTMNGFETCRRILAAGVLAGRTPKVWFITGCDYPGLEAEAAKAGGAGVFRKPFDWPAILGRLRDPPRHGPAGKPRV